MLKSRASQQLRFIQRELEPQSAQLVAVKAALLCPCLPRGAVDRAVCSGLRSQPLLLLRPDAPSRVLCCHEANCIPVLSSSLSPAVNPARQTPVPHGIVLLHQHSQSLPAASEKREICCDDFREGHKAPLHVSPAPADSPLKELTYLALV